MIKVVTGGHYHYVGAVEVEEIIGEEKLKAKFLSVSYNEYFLKKNSVRAFPNEIVELCVFGITKPDYTDWVRKNT